MCFAQAMSSPNATIIETSILRGARDDKRILAFAPVLVTVSVSYVHINIRTMALRMRGLLCVCLLRDDVLGASMMPPRHEQYGGNENPHVFDTPAHEEQLHSHHRSQSHVAWHDHVY